MEMSDNESPVQIFNVASNWSNVVHKLQKILTSAG